MPSSQPVRQFTTQQQIADTLGLSRVTVAEILGSRRPQCYNAETRERVEAAAKKMNYRPNRNAQMMRRSRSNLIAIIHFSSRYEIVQKSSACLPRAVTFAGYDYIVLDLQWHGGNVERIFEELIRLRVEGVIICQMNEMMTPEHVGLLKKSGIAVVTIFGDDRLKIPLICDDAKDAFYSMARHLQSRGHRRIMLCVGKDLSLRNNRKRIEGFQMAFRAPCPIIDGDLAQWAAMKKPSPKTKLGVIFSFDTTVYRDITMAYYEFAKQLFDFRHMPSALMCADDAAALGVFHAALEKNIQIPGDIAITGSDNDTAGSYPVYSLTTIEKDIESVCEKAVVTLVDQITKGITVVAPQKFSSRLIIRESCLSPKSRK